jgi:ATP-dependent exoDNAse (exonuclease V) beta subunit
VKGTTLLPLHKYCCRKYADVADPRFIFTVQTPDWDGEREKELAEAESLRLWYVAATRAREHLVLSLFRNSNSGSPAARIAEFVQAPDSNEYRWIGLLPPSQLNDTGVNVPGEDVVSLGEYTSAEDAWVARRSEQLRRLAALHIATPSGLESDDLPEPVPEGVGWSRTSGSALGPAVHAVLQRVRLDDLSDLHALASGAAQECAVDADLVVAHARRATLSVAVRQAVESGRFWREVPVGIREGHTLIEGTIDLLKEYADGTLGVVDYKTDQLSRAAVPARAAYYAFQGGAYALAVERATRRTVSSLEFVFTSPADGEVVRYDADHVRDLMNQAAAAARVGEQA